MRRRLSIVIITNTTNYFLPPTIKSLFSELTAANLELEIIVVAQTIDPKVPAYLAHCGLTPQKIKFFQYPVDLNYAKAASYAFSKTNGELICYLETPLDFVGLNIRMLLAYLDQDNADLAVATKTLTTPSPYPLLIQGASPLALITNKLLFNFPFWETDIKVKLFKRAVLTQALPRLTGQITAFNFELLLICHHLGFRMTTAPLKTNKDLSWQLNWRGFWRLIKEEILIFLNLALFRAYQKPKPAAKLLINARQLAV